MKSILVTGSYGFIPSAYVREIRKRGFGVIEYDLPDSNILDVDNLREHIKRADIVIHFAAVADLNESAANQDKNFDVNIRGTYNVASICCQEYKPLIFISTCCVYGNSLDDIQLEEKTAPQAREPYACSKVAGEEILKGMPYLRYMILRIGTVYGPGMREALFTFIALDKVNKGETITIHGDGLQSRQLIFIDDLVDGMARATEHFDGVPNCSIINLCGIEHISALDTMFVAQDVVGKRAMWEHGEQRYNQTWKENVSIERAWDYFRWTPATNFVDGMRFTFKNDKRFKCI